MSFSLKRVFKKSRRSRSLYWLLVLNWIDHWVKRSPAAKRDAAKKRVVFVKMDGIGDYVIWTAAFRTIREQYPSEDHERILVANDRFRELAEDEPTFDRKIFVNHEKLVLSPAYRSKVMHDVRELAAEIIINARSTRDFLWADSIIRCSAAEQKIGSEDAGSMVSAADLKYIRRWYSHVRPGLKPGEHELIWHAKFLGVPIQELSVSGALDAIPLTGRLVEGDYAVLFIGAQSAEKCLPAGHFGHVANHLSRKHGLRVVLCGGPDAGHLVDGFKKVFTGDSLDFIGPTAIALSKVVNLIRSARMIVANDTGAAHIAVFAGRPTIVTAPGNQPGRYFPYPEAATELGIDRLQVIQEKSFCEDCNEDCKFTRAHAESVRPCLQAITVKEVVDAIDELYRNT